MAGEAAQAIDRLLRDHRNMMQLLRILESEVAQFRSAGAADFDLLFQIMDYIINYPDLYHHLEENAIFLRLKLRGSMSTAQLNKIRHEHEEMAAQNRRLAAAFHNLEQGRDVPTQWIAELVDSCVSMTFGHIKEEEERYFPQAMDLIDGETWHDIDEELQRREDPLFGENVRAHYLKLHEQILRLALTV